MKVFFLLLVIFISSALAQSEILTNSDIIEMSQAGLGKQLIIDKIKGAKCKYDVSARGMIELKKARVEDEIISAMIDCEKAVEVLPKPEDSKGFSDSQPPEADLRDSTDPAWILKNAKTVAIKKSSVHPSRQALEKELIKRKEWAKLKLTITEYKESADIFIQIGRVPFSWLTHRYVYRIYDNRTGTLIAAGETTSWGSLAENLAGNIAKSIEKVIEAK